MQFHIFIIYFYFYFFPFFGGCICVPCVYNFIALRSTHCHNTHAHIHTKGCTGFIGIHLLSQLLNDTPAHTRLYCLVRAASEAAARERVMVHARRQQLSRLVLELSRDCGGFGGEGEGRVHMVAGDLSADEYCGVAEEQWHWLSAHVNVLFHCAAEVNWMKLYGNLRAVNVLACLHLLRMATHGGQPTSFHHVSTISCAPAHSDDQRAYEGVLSLEAAQVPGTLGGPCTCANEGDVCSLYLV